LDRPALVAHAREAIAAGSKSFASASRLFDRATRERVWLLYAWCRACDDLADDQQLGGTLGEAAGSAGRLATIRDLSAKALAGKGTGNPSFDALGIVAAECGLTATMAEDVIAGFALDAADWRPRTTQDLLDYCFHVAGAVGVMMAVVMGVAPDDGATLRRACDLGLAFQLSNIARDVSEDDAAGRCYLPTEWLAEAGIPPGEHMKPHYRPALVPLVRRLTDMAANYEVSARIGAARLPFRSRWAVLSAAGIYGAIGREVTRRGVHAWDQRVVVSKQAKLGFVARALWQSLSRRGTPPAPPPGRN
jgi:phytoene synthase